MLQNHYSSSKLVCPLMSQLKYSVINADTQFTAKSLQRQAKKANKDETTEKNKVKLVSDPFLLNHP